VWLTTPAGEPFETWAVLVVDLFILLLHAQYVGPSAYKPMNFTVLSCYVIV
jgi:hypothetical protein